MDTSQLFRNRLRRDLRDIELNVDPGIRVHVASNDMRRLCLHLTPESGPWQSLTVHFNVELPTNWVGVPICHTSPDRPCFHFTTINPFPV